MSTVKFSEMTSAFGVLADHVIQTLRREAPQLHTEALRQSKNGTLRFDNGLGEKIDDFYAQQEAQRDTLKRLHDSAEADKFLKAHNECQMAEVQRACDRRLGLSRLEQFAVEQNLVRSESNALKVQQWLDENVKGWSASNVDAAVSVLRNQLEWGKSTSSAPVKPQPTVWSPGQPLPKNATTAMLRHPSVTPAQIREWLKNKNK